MYFIECLFQKDKYLNDVISIVTLKSVFAWLIVAFLVAVIAWLFHKNGRIKLITFISLPALAFYLSFVSTVTILSRIPSSSIQYNIKLFWTYTAILEGNNKLITEILWNVVLFIPIGLLLMIILTHKHKIIISVVGGFILSFAIELIQLVFHRGLFEFDDMVHNTLGAAIGAIIYILVSSTFMVFKSKRIY